MATVRVPHFTHPFRMRNTASSKEAAAVAEQDSIEEIMTCVESVLRYPIGYRNEKPEFGIDDQTFKQVPIDESFIEKTINRWEPRADLIITEAPDEFDQLVDRIRILPAPTQLREEA